MFEWLPEIPDFSLIEILLFLVLIEILSIDRRLIKTNELLIETAKQNNIRARNQQKIATIMNQLSNAINGLGRKLK